MSLRRLRKLAGLNESITDDPALNSEIDRRLNTLPKEIQMPVLDALEVLQSAGEKGLTLTDWAATIRQMYGDGEMPMGEVLKTAVSSFPIVVRKLAPKHYGWHVTKSDQTEVDDDPVFSVHTGAVIDLQKRAMALIRSNGGEFTVQELRNRLYRLSSSLPRPFIDNFVDHFIESLSGSLRKEGDTYIMQMETPDTRENTMQHFRDIVANPRKD